MASRWTIRVDVRAVRDLYTLPRGIAGDVTDAIDGLPDNPIPEEAEPVESLDDVYRLIVGPNVVEYQVVADEQVIKILNIA
jgi:mRNA-degrading endonuclease RelE of RelBE toxin-antitoxin system